MWPNYSATCRKAVDTLLDGKHSLTGYRSNKAWGLPPCDWSWAYKFEKELEKRLKAKHAVALNSGTMALEAALYALDLPPGSDIVTSPYTFSATPASIILAGHRPVFADVNPYDFTIDPESVKKVITRKTRAIIPVDLFGGLANYEALEKFGLPIISDHCQAVGAQKGGKYTFGQITACSGNGGKNLPMGEGGFCLTDDAKLAKRMRLFISHGENFDSPEVGRNGRLPEMTAAVAYHGLLDLVERNERRMDLAYRVAYQMHNQKPDGLHWNTCGFRGEHVYYVMPWVLHKGVDRAKFAKRMARKGFPVGEGYTVPLHNKRKFPAFAPYYPGRLPEVERLSFKSLFILTTLTPDRPLSYADEVAEAMKECLR